MGLKDSSPPEFVKIDHELYNVHVITKEGASYYKSYHNEQLRDFFTLEHHLHQQELPSKIPAGFEDFHIAFDREAERKNLSGVSFTQINYDGVEPLVNSLDPRLPLTYSPRGAWSGCGSKVPIGEAGNQGDDRRRGRCPMPDGY